MQIVSKSVRIAVEAIDSSPEKAERIAKGLAPSDIRVTRPIGKQGE